MTTTIMARPVPRPTDVVALQTMHDLLARMARESDRTVPPERRARRNLQEMAPGYEQQPVLVLHRPVMADDSCPLCGRWNCDPNNCPPRASASPVPVTAGSGMQCEVCGGWFGVAPALPGGPLTAWTCGACQNLGR